MPDTRLSSLLAKPTNSRLNQNPIIDKPTVENTEVVPSEAAENVKIEIPSTANFIKPPVINRPEPPVAAVPAVETLQPPVAPIEPIPDNILRTSAKTTVMGIDIAQSTALTLMVDYRFHSKSVKAFGGEDKANLAHMYVDQDSYPDDDASKQMYQRMKRMNNKYQKTRSSIPFSGEEKQQLEEVYYEYYKLNQVTMSPGTMLVISTVTILSRRVADIMFD